jgi:lysophospholipase L1-like esterase
MMRLGFALVFLSLTGALRAAPEGGRWVGTWVSAQQLTEPGNLPPAPGLAGCTLRQVIHPTLAGDRVRVTFSNVFGHRPLMIASAHLARSAGDSAIESGSDQPLTFAGAASVTIEAGASMISDAVPFKVDAGKNLAVTLYLQAAPADLTGHPGSRTTSFIQAGDAVAAPSLTDARRVDHWYLLGGVDVWTRKSAAAVVVMGDSITDGRGSTTNGNDRWPDDFARRLAGSPATANVAVLNQGIGGNRLLRDGLGPNVLARFDRDVLAPPGVRWLIVFEGVNDLGTAVGARAKHAPAASAADIIAALRQIVVRAHAHGLRVYGATITPFEGFTAYSTPESEADRQKVNQWIRTSGFLDAVIDFDAAVRDPNHPARLAAAFDCGDHLHPSVAGHSELGRAVDLALFGPTPGAAPALQP